MKRTHPTSVLLMLMLCVSLGGAAPDGAEEEPWSYPDGYFADRDTYPEQEPNNNCGVDDQPVSCGDVVDPGCIMAEGDHDWYVFSADEGDLITCGTAESAGLPTVDTYIELYRNNCITVLDFDDDSGPGLYSLISDFTAPYTGEYHLLVRAWGDYGTGCYMCFFTCLPQQPAGLDFQVSGVGDTTTYGIRFEVDGLECWLEQVSHSEGATAAQIVAGWRQMIGLDCPQLAARFIIDPQDGSKFRLVGDDISVKIDPGEPDECEVVGNPDGCPFNPILYCLSDPTTTIETTWGRIKAGYR